LACPVHRDESIHEAGTLERVAEHLRDHDKPHTLESEGAGVARGVVGWDLHLLAIRLVDLLSEIFLTPEKARGLKTKKKNWGRGPVCVCFVLLVE
jgi:hypothetical protein